MFLKKQHFLKVVSLFIIAMGFPLTIPGEESLLTVKEQVTHPNEDQLIARSSTYQRRRYIMGPHDDPSVDYQYWGNYYFSGYPNEYYKPRKVYYYSPKYFYGTGNGGVYFYKYEK